MNITTIGKTNLKPKADALFKAIFGTKAGKPLLETLLKDILNKDVEIIEYKNRELPKISATEKTKIIDLLVKIKHKLVHIEVNSSYSKIIRFRNFVYFAGVILLDHRVGTKYNENQKYISINLTSRMAKKHKLIEVYKLQNDDLDEYIDNIKIYEVNIDKAKLLCQNGDKREKVKHIAALGMTEEEIEKYKEGDKFMESLSKRLGRLNPGGISFVTPEEDDMMLMNSMKLAARRAGEESGMKKGMKRGLKQGIEQGTKENQNRIIKNMLKMGLSFDSIEKYTSVDRNIIENINNELNN